MSVRMIPSLTEDGDMRFDVFEHPKMTIVGRFFVNPTMDEVSMVANGTFCTREMVISKQKRSYFAARKDNQNTDIQNWRNKSRFYHWLRVVC